MNGSIGWEKESQCELVRLLEELRALRAEFYAIKNGEKKK